MSAFPELEKYSRELDKCVTCGICHTVCPSYNLSGRELYSPRGRIVLLRRLLNQGIRPDQVTSDTFDFCTLCYACQTVCPAGVKTDILFIAAREALARANGINRAKQRVFDLLVEPKKVERAVRLGSAAQGVLGVGTVNRLAGGVSVPRLRPRPYLHELRDVYKPLVRRKLRVALFLGCLSNYVDAEAARAVIEVLIRVGAEVTIPQQQVCCGAPAFNNGDFDTARQLAIRNLETIKDTNADFVVSPDATCGGAFMHEIPELMAEDDEYAFLSREIAEKTLDFASLVVDELNAEFPETHEPELVVTVHDSCHLTHTRHGEGKVRELLERLPGVRVVEMAESTVCCGFGGSFSALYPDESHEWTERKVQNIIATEAPVVVVPSPGCISQIRRGLDSGRAKKAVAVLHPAQVITKRCGWVV